MWGFGCGGMEVTKSLPSISTFGDSFFAQFQALALILSFGKEKPSSVLIVAALQNPDIHDPTGQNFFPVPTADNQLSKVGSHAGLRAVLPTQGALAPFHINLFYHHQRWWS